MATLTTLVDGEIATVAPVNANFTALNTEIAGASRTGYSTAVGIGNVLTGNDTLQSWTMPANTLTAVGDGLRIFSHFTFAANANTKTVGFYVGSSAITFINATTGAPNAKDMFVDLVVSVRSLAVTFNLVVLGTVILCNTISGASPAFEALLSNGSGGISAGSLAAPVLVKFTGEGTATNDIVQNMTLISIFKAAS